jgi:hypothetical protein
MHLQKRAECIKIRWYCKVVHDLVNEMESIFVIIELILPALNFRHIHSYSREIIC